jgi:hypothetical protein
LTGGLDWSSDDIRVILCDSGYVFDPTDDFLDDVAGGARLATSGSLTGKTATDGVADADDVTFPTVLAGDTVTSLIVYKHTGTEATSDLILYMDETAAGAVINRLTDGNDIVVRWSNSATKIFKL